MTQPMSPEREKEIRNVDWCPYGCDIDIKELLAEIDRLRAENEKLRKHFDHCDSDKIVSLTLERDQARVQLGDAHLEMAKLREKISTATIALSRISHPALSRR